MTPATIRNFVAKPPPASRTFQLVAQLGLGSTSVVESWTRDECEAAVADINIGADDIGDRVFGAALNYANNVGEAMRFELQWLNATDKIIKSTTHSAVPNDKVAGATGIVAGEAMTANRIISELLIALREKDKWVKEAMSASLQAANGVLALQAKTIEHYAKVEAERPTAAESVALAVTPPELVEAELQASKLKAEALGKLIEFGPQIAMLGVATIAKHLGIDLPGGGDGPRRHEDA